MTLKVSSNSNLMAYNQTVSDEDDDTQELVTASLPNFSETSFTLKPNEKRHIAFYDCSQASNGNKIVSVTATRDDAGLFGLTLGFGVMISLLLSIVLF